MPCSSDPWKPPRLSASQSPLHRPLRNRRPTIDGACQRWIVTVKVDRKCNRKQLGNHLSILRKGIAKESQPLGSRILSFRWKPAFFVGFLDFIASRFWTIVCRRDQKRERFSAVIARVLVRYRNGMTKLADPYVPLVEIPIGMRGRCGQNMIFISVANPLPLGSKTWT